MKMGPAAEKRQMRFEKDRPAYEIADELERFDERDNVQARAELSPSDAAWKEYYALHPEWEEKDLAVKELPGLGMVGHPLDRMLMMAQGLAVQLLSNEAVVTGPAFGPPQEMSAARAAEKVKGVAYLLGADLVRVGPLNPALGLYRTSARAG